MPMRMYAEFVLEFPENAIVAHVAVNDLCVSIYLN